MSKRIVKSLKRSCEIDLHDKSSKKDDSNMKQTKSKPKRFRMEMSSESSSMWCEKVNVVNQEMVDSDMEKDILRKFLAEVSSIYVDKYGELIRKQLLESETLKKSFTDKIKTELDDWVCYISRYNQYEEELHSLLNEIKYNFNTSDVEEKRFKTIFEMHKDFIQAYKELIENHKLESEALRTTVNKKVLHIKTKFFRESNI